MPLALGRLVLITLGCFGPLRGTICAAGVTPAQHDKNTQSNSKIIPWDSSTDYDSDGLPADFPVGFALTNATDSRPPQVGFRRPQFELQRRDGTCLANGTNFCFGDANSYCSACGTCCSSSSNSNSKWCCPSDGICCGSSCCGSGQTCSNGQCYLPVETVTSTSLVATTATQVATKLVTIVLQVLETTVTNQIVTVTNTNADTQTNWQYVTVTAAAAKRAVPTDKGPGDDSSYKRMTSVAPAGTAPALASLETASKTTAEEFTAPTLANELIQELIKRQQAEDAKNTMAASKSTTVVQTVITSTAIISSTALSTTTVQTTSLATSTSTQTVTTVLNAIATVSSVSIVTNTPRVPITLTRTEVATVPFSASQSSTTSSSTTSPAGLQTVTPVVAKNGLASGAIAGIAVGVAVVALAAGFLAFFCIRRHRSNKKVRQSISEDYAYLGTGRSESTGGPGVMRTNSGSPAMQQTIGYTGPPPPGAVAMAGGRPITRQVTMQSDDHGLPPTPNFTRMPTKRSARSSTSAASASSPISATSQSLPFGSDTVQSGPGSGVAHSGSNGRKSHARSASAITSLTAASSTVVGGSARNSVQSTPGMTKAMLATAGSGQMHKRASSSGGGSGVTVETLAELPAGDNEDSHDNIRGSTMSSSTTPPPPPRSNERPSTAPDPPSPYLEPRLGPLRIVNTPATPPTVPSIPEPTEFELEAPLPPRSA